MNKVLQNEYAPDRVSPPGDTLRETLDALGMTQAELAERLGRSRKAVNEIVQGKAPITHDTALQLERVLGVPAAFWNSREAHYREYRARVDEREALRDCAEWARRFPMREMARRGWIRKTADEIEQAAELLSFFGVASPREWHSLWSGAGVVFRRAQSSRLEPLAAWLRYGELEAQSVDTRRYDASAFREALARIRELTTEPPSRAMKAAQQSCAEVGVALVVVPELPGTGAWGATRWLAPHKALLQLSCRYKREDHLWFSFFHEAAHILKHGKKKLFVDGGPERRDKEQEGREEIDADHFAEDTLIPPAKYREFVEERTRYFSKAAIREFAGRIGIAPGIVVGRLQHDGYIEQKSCNDLRRKVNL